MARIPASGDYRIGAGELKREGSWLATARRNVDIIELVHTIEQEKRPATAAEQAQLVKFVGWGAGEIRNQLFPTQAGVGKDYKTWYLHGEWKDLGERIQAVFTADDWRTVLKSTQYAHYTSEPVVRSIWRALERLGFAGGSVLEPGAGIGVFAGLMPDAIARNSQYVGVEMDGFSAKIARLLLPGQTINPNGQGDYVAAKLPRSFFDVAIGNPPFSKTKIPYNGKKLSLHDFFFAKTLDQVRPGGLIAFVTSRYTMDKKDDTARQYLMERADLLGAVRLPQTAFKQNAGTEVTTDVLFFRKREPGQQPAGAKWGSLSEVESVEGDTIQVNEYFAAHPEMVLGRHSTTVKTLHAGENYGLTPIEGADIEDLFATAIEQLPTNVYSVASPSTSEKTVRAAVVEKDFNPKHRKEGGIYLADDGRLMRVEQGAGTPLESMVKLSAKERQWLIDYVPLRDALKQAHYDQLSDGEWKTSLRNLQETYDRFVEEHGPVLDYTLIEKKDIDEDGNEIIRTVQRGKNERLLRMDAEGALLSGLEEIKEDGSIVKAPVLLDRVMKKPVTPRIENVHDALAVSLAQTWAPQFSRPGLANETYATLSPAVGEADLDLDATEKGPPAWTVQGYSITRAEADRLHAAGFPGIHRFSTRGPDTTGLQGWVIRALPGGALTNTYRERMNYVSGLRIPPDPAIDALVQAIVQSRDRLEFSIDPPPPGRRAQNMPWKVRVVRPGSAQPPGLYSRGGGAVGAPVATLRARLLKDFGRGVAALERAGVLHIVQSLADLPAEIRAYTRGDEEGAYWRGQAWIVADNTTLIRARSVLLHEIGEHFGLKRMLGEKAYAALQARIARLNANGSKRVRAAWDAVLREYRGANGELLFPEGSERHIAEVIAQLGESEVFTKAPWWRALLARIKVFLIAHGFRGLVRTLSDTELNALLLASVRQAGALQGQQGPSPNPLQDPHPTLSQGERGFRDRGEGVSRSGRGGHELPLRDDLAGFARQFGVTPEQLRKEFEAVAVRHLGSLAAYEALPAAPGENGLKAPNGQPTALNKQQWVMVRTPRFKAWFGDWERAAAIQELTEGEPIEVQGNEIAEFSEPLDMHRLRDLARDYGEAQVVGQYTNAPSGLTLEVRRHGIDESIQHGSGPEKLKAFAAIPALLRTGQVVYDGPNPKKRGRLVVISGLVNIGGKRFAVSAGIREDASGRLYYDHEMLEVRRIDGLSSQSGEGLAPHHPGPKSTRLNHYYRQFIAEKVASSQVVDENGEPLVVFHGTNQAFNIFETAAGPRSKAVGDWAGVHFSNDPAQARSIAESVARGEGGQARVVEAFLRAGKPAPFGKFRSMAAAISAGHDARLTENNTGLQEWTVFRPEQIKSATGNSGAFDAGNPDIRYRRPEDRFARWFGASKIRKGGKPLVVYHGTQTDFEAFDKLQLARATGHETAAFLKAGKPEAKATVSRNNLD